MSGKFFISRQSQQVFLVTVFLLLCFVASAVAVGSNEKTESIDQKGISTTFIINASKYSTGVIRPVYNRFIAGHSSTPPLVTKRFPYLEEIVLMTVTGGRSGPEMYSESGGVPSYNFTFIDKTLDTVIGENIKPTIGIGNTPVALSDRPTDFGGYNTNIGYPKNYTKYYNYIKSLFQHLIARYNKSTVGGWEYRLMTEPDGSAMWYGSPSETALIAYEKLYDYTFAAMRDAGIEPKLYVGNFVDGACTKGSPCWISRIPQWLNSTSNPYHLNVIPRYQGKISVSCYAFFSGSTPHLGSDPRDLKKFIDTVRGYISPYLPNAEINVGEGGILKEDGRTSVVMWEDSSELGAAWNAALYKVAHDVNLEKYNHWGIDPDGPGHDYDASAGIVKSPIYNVMWMYERMRGERRITVTENTGNLVVSSAYVDAIASKNTSGKVSAIIYNYNSDRSVKGDELVTLKFAGLNRNQKYIITHYRIDHNHSNFFPTWFSYASSKGLIVSSACVNRSYYSIFIQEYLYQLQLCNLFVNPISFWREKRSGYTDIDDIEKLESDYIVSSDSGGLIQKDITLPPNSVSLIELMPDFSPKGYLDSAGCSYIGGWACDENNYSQPLAIHVYDGQYDSGGKLVGYAVANTSREQAVGDLCGGYTGHGFEIPTPSLLKDGLAHNIYAYAINTPFGSSPAIGNKTIMCMTTTTTTSTSTTSTSTSTTTSTTRSTTTTTTTFSSSTSSSSSTTTTTILRVPGDADGDGHVDYRDLIILTASYGKSTGQAGFDVRADFNADGVVGYDDLIVLAANYGR